MKIGDFVRIKNTESEGVISQILSEKKIEVVLDNGFTVKVETAKIDLCSPPEEIKKQKKKYTVSIPPPKVDLHIQMIMDNYKGISNSEIVKIQLKQGTES